ncbi:hypothetical protein LEMLEM_LOCUS17541 [Lemmus lemmus]
MFYFIIFIYMYVFGYVHVSASVCHRGIRSLGPGVTGGYESPDRGVKNQT